MASLVTKEEPVMTDPTNHIVRRLHWCAHGVGAGLQQVSGPAHGAGLQCAELAEHAQVVTDGPALGDAAVVEAERGHEVP